MPEKTETHCRLVVCFDGTWNTPDSGAKPTNVVKMVRAVRCRDGKDGKGTRQLVFYDKGVGTGGWTDRLSGGASGKGLTENVIDGYRFLANNHRDGDEIYIFGFSRGAYTARSLAGLVGLAGMLPPQRLGGDLQEVLGVYKDKDLEPKQKRAKVDAMRVPGRRPRAPVTCVGVWDTVGSLGIPTDFARRINWVGKHHFHDVQLGAHIGVALHAVAIDEKRAAFPPTLWERDETEPPVDGQRVEQVWFAGVHSNVGGSYADSGLSDIALDWMCKRVSKLTFLDLDFTPYSADRPGNVVAPGIESRTLAYKGSMLYPYQRIINREIPSYDGFGAWFRRTCEPLDRRYSPSEPQLRTVSEKLHVSVLDRWKEDAVPHDCKGGGPCEKVPYRPITLAAVVRAHHEGRSMPVVDWDGEEVRDRDVWPESRTLP